MILFFLRGFGEMCLVFLIWLALLLFPNIIGVATFISALEVLAYWGVTLICLFLIAYLLIIVISATGRVGLNIISVVLFVGFIFAIAIISNTVAGLVTDPLVGQKILILLGWIGFVILTIALLNIPNIILVTRGLFLASRTPAAPPGSSTPSLSEEDWRSYMVGLNTAMNMLVSFAVYAVIFSMIMSTVLAILLAAFLSLVIAFVNFRSIFLSSTRSNRYKSVLGLVTVFMPMAWLVNSLGVLFYFISLVFHPLGFIPFLPSFNIISVTVRPSTKAIINIGGICANLNLIPTAYNLGNFILIYMLTTRAVGPETSHEDGHHLNLGSLGSNFHFIGWFDEFFGSAYAELLAEGNVPGSVVPGRESRPALDVWNT